MVPKKLFYLVYFVVAALVGIGTWLLGTGIGSLVVDLFHPSSVCATDFGWAAVTIVTMQVVIDELRRFVGGEQEEMEEEG